MADFFLTILQAPLKNIYLLLQPHFFLPEQLQLIYDVLFHVSLKTAVRTGIAIVVTAVTAACCSQNHAETTVHLFIYRGEDQRIKDFNEPTENTSKQKHQR